MAIATNLKQIRMERNLLQEDLAIAIGSCGRTIGRDVPVEKLFQVND